MYKAASLLFETALFHSEYHYLAIFVSIHVRMISHLQHLGYTIQRLNGRDLIVAVQPFNEMPFSQFRCVI